MVRQSSHAKRGVLSLLKQKQDYDLQQQEHTMGKERAGHHDQAKNSISNVEPTKGVDVLASTSILPSAPHSTTDAPHSSSSQPKP